MDLVAVSDLSKWRETLALLSTYGKNEVQYRIVQNWSVVECIGLWVVTSFTSTIEIVLFYGGFDLRFVVCSGICIVECRNCAFFLYSHTELVYKGDHDVCHTPICPYPFCHVALVLALTICFYC